MNLVKITRERDQVRRIFARHAQIVEDSIKDNKLQNLDVDIEYLENQITSLSLLDKQVQDELFSKEDYKPEDGDKEWDQCEKYKERWLKIRGAAKKRVGSKCEKSPAQNVNNLKLPKIEIRKFDDNPKSWLPFWGQFKKINDDPNLDNEDKFQYLIQSMEIGSNARNLVESYPPTKENYVKIIELLKTRFARDEILIEIYVRELLKLVVSRNSISVDVLYDKVIANLQTLETLGVMKDKYECILFPLVESALPESTLLSWSRIQRDKEAKLSQLLEFLKLEMEAEDRLKLAKTDLLGRDGTASGGVGPTAACLFTSKEEKVKPSTSYGYEGKDCCYFCEKPHNSAECTELARPHIQKFDNKQAEKVTKKASKLQKRHKVMVRYKNTTPTVDFDEPTKYLLRRLVSSRYMSRFDHIIGTGSNSVVIFGNSSTCWSWRLPYEVVVKVYENNEAACKRAQNELKSLDRLERCRINAPRPVCAWRNIIVMGVIGYGTTALSITSAPPEDDLINYLHIIDSMRRMYQIAKVVHGNLSHRSIIRYGPPYFISLAHSVPTDHADALKLLIKDCFNVTHLFKDKGLSELKTTEELFKFITDLPEIDDSLLEILENIKTSKPKSYPISYNSKYPIEKPPANYAPVLEFCSKLHR